MPQDRLQDQSIRKEISVLLDKSFWQRNPYRSLYIPFIYAALAINVYIVNQAFAGKVNWVYCLISIFLTGNFASGGFFIMHELLHGAILKKGFLKWWISLFGGAICLVTPHLWSRWHQWHHRHTSGPLDTERMRHPDWDNLNSFNAKLKNFLIRFSYFRPISFLFSFFVVMGYHFLMAIEAMIGIAPFKSNRLIILGEFALSLLIFFSPWAFLSVNEIALGLIVPIAMANFICSIYIITNHNDNPLTTENVTILNSTSVNFFIFKWSHFDFGRHVEHHLFPGIDHRKLRQVSAHLRELYPADFCEKPFKNHIASIYSRPLSYFQPIVDTRKLLIIDFAEQRLLMQQQTYKNEELATFTQGSA